MSRWLDLAAEWENSKRVPDNRLKPAESLPADDKTAFLPVLAGCRAGVSDKRNEPTTTQGQGDASPFTCAICGERDWTVSLTDIDRRKYHIACWKSAMDRKQAYGFAPPG
ncbi:hypothetical protein [Sedimentimonas flavescens]|uniref:hypothetical protein n=1 Tax=Sedimentimonas flavescens TaxID=2851012 RepID=UPI001C4A227E|nr:hypothetical protein [Sedimentimonas flavescens]MBW0159395.1 hypothetical protein [Sedimentimonas flavescens]